MYIIKIREKPRGFYLSSFSTHHVEKNMKRDHHISEQKAMPSVKTSCIRTCVSIGIMASSAPLPGSRSSSKYCR